MDMFKEKEIREQMQSPMPMVGIIIMVCGALLYFATLLYTLILGGAESSAADPTILWILSVLNLVGMLLFMFGTVIQVSRLADVIRNLREYIGLEESRRERESE